MSFSNCISIHLLSAGEVDEEKEREHSSMQDQLDKELQELDKRLQQKEVLFPCLSYLGFLELYTISASCLLNPTNTSHFSLILHVCTDVVLFPQSASQLFCALIHLENYNYTSFSRFKRQR